jgi:hypothetical protein
VKWGRDALVTDESTTRLNFDPVNRALTKLGNGMIRQIDSVALGVIASKVTQSFAASATWTEAGPIIDTVLQSTAKAKTANLDFGTYDYDTIVLDPLQFALVAGEFLKSTLLPREQAGNQVISGVISGYLGKGLGHLGLRAGDKPVRPRPVAARRHGRREDRVARLRVGPERGRSGRRGEVHP